MPIRCSQNTNKLISCQSGSKHVLHDNWHIFKLYITLLIHSSLLRHIMAISPSYDRLRHRSGKNNKRHSFTKPHIENIAIDETGSRTKIIIHVRHLSCYVISYTTQLSRYELLRNKHSSEDGVLYSGTKASKQKQEWN